MFGLYPNSYKEILSIFKKNKNIDEVIIFGSRAKGTYREGSDIDFAIIGNVTYDDIIKLKIDFDNSSIPYLIDVVVYESITSKKLREHIQRVGKQFYQKNKTEAVN